jgi:hypothetical protein
MDKAKTPRSNEFENFRKLAKSGERTEAGDRQAREGMEGSA